MRSQESSASWGVELGRGVLPEAGHVAVQPQPSRLQQYGGRGVHASTYREVWAARPLAERQACLCAASSGSARVLRPEAVWRCARPDREQRGPQGSEPMS